VSDISKDEGAFVALVARGKKRLARAERIKERVDAGERLTPTDIDFLEEVFRTSNENAALVERHPEWHEIYGKTVRLYKELMDKALENEESGKR